ncbi:hypothetical protein DNTS_023158 [Danionella cerebrum]|uniref:SUN domain-containing protein n=1 Tax=Danionella cerebrum TaxID=2873325 RepID=A0A553MQV6_9TELE|nr:hypothetical protein DNTS_023158 [Danionella translucida]TRY55565.1 hypothetical protein DNTS_023158 [Danionella translucida]
MILKSRRSCHSVSGSAQFQTPRCASTSILRAHNSTLNSCALSDASLLSSLLDESSIQERTLVDSFWGLDDDHNPNDQAVISHPSTVEATAQTSRAPNGSICKECTVTSSSQNISSLHNASGDQAFIKDASTTESVPKTTLYTRDKSRTLKPGNKNYYGNMSVKEVAFQKERPKFSGGEQSRIAPCGSSNSLQTLCYWGPSGLMAMFPVSKLIWGSPHLTPISPLGGSEEGKTTEGETESLSMSSSSSSSSSSSVEYERLLRLEESLSQLWDRVAGSLLRQEEQHTEMLSLYNTLHSELHRHTDRESLGTWIGDLLEERFSLLKEAKHTQQEKQTEERQSEKTRLSEAEALLQMLTRRTERKQEPSIRKIPEPEEHASVTEDDEAEHQSTEALLGEVRHLEAALESVRADVQGLMGCRDRCEQLDSISSTVSAQVEKEIRTLFHDSDGGEELPESLLQWLSERFVSTSELQASLSALENSILGNLSLQLEEGQSPSEETIARTVQQATAESGLSEEHVQLIVNNALKLFSEDRTGMVDYALESGGGSIISTRCSESFNTKTALLSLFGLPLWYFSQSPRVVIQPDVHPGNCWAFKGSSGYLVIGLSMEIVPTAFTLEHVAKSLSPTGNISSAPREFNVYGLDDEEQEEGQLLGEFLFEEDGESLQSFPVSEEISRGFRIIEVKVLSNWGHPEYTCLYRFRVHGKHADE